MELLAPRPRAVIGDRAGSAAAFLTAAGEYLREHRSTLWHDRKRHPPFHDRAFRGVDVKESDSVSAA